MLTNDTKQVWDERKKQIRKNKFRSLTLNGRKNVINEYYNYHRGYKVDFDNPKNFSEKLQVRKLSKNPLFTLCADKDKIREYVKEKIGENLLSNCAMNRFAKTEEIADLVAFLASDKSSFINGQVIRIDGGAK